MASRQRLKQHLARLGWSYVELSAWLTDMGEPVSVRAIESWMSDAPSGRSCPAWPSILIETDERMRRYKRIADRLSAHIRDGTTTEIN